MLNDQTEIISQIAKTVQEPEQYLGRVLGLALRHDKEIKRSRYVQLAKLDIPFHW